MPPHVARDKIQRMAEFLEELEQYEGINFEEFKEKHHYAIERLMELLVIYASDIMLHLLTEQGEEMPMTLRTVFLRAGELQILPTALAQRLADAAGMRNLLVHAYAKVDMRIVYDSINQALLDFSQFVEIMSLENGIIRKDSTKSESDDPTTRNHEND